MTVKELIKALSKLDEDLDVVTTVHDGFGVETNIDVYESYLVEANFGDVRLTLEANPDEGQKVVVIE